MPAGRVLRSSLRCARARLRARPVLKALRVRWYTPYARSLRTSSSARSRERRRRMVAAASRSALLAAATPLASSVARRWVRTVYCPASASVQHSSRASASVRCRSAHQAQQGRGSRSTLCRLPSPRPMGTCAVTPGPSSSASVGVGPNSPERVPTQRSSKASASTATSYFWGATRSMPRRTQAPRTKLGR
jgi:hypothetical protein